MVTTRVIHKLTCTAIAFSFSIAAQAAGPKLAPELRVPGEGAIDVIVQFKSVPGASHKNKIRLRGGQIKADLRLVKGVVATMSPAQAAALARDPEVAYISSDRVIHAALDNTAAAVNANYAWTLGYDGTGIGVAVIDSGIANHPDLKNSAGALRVVYNQDFIGGGTDDHYGHGEHVAGILAGNGSRSTGSAFTRTFKGMAPNAYLINLRVLDQYGKGTDSTVINAINQAIALKSKYNIRVINLSLGRPVYESYTLDPLCQAVEKAYQAGMVVVVATGNEGRNNSAGNNGYATITAPGCDHRRRHEDHGHTQSGR